jgi:hypothetical protein
MRTRAALLLLPALTEFVLISQSLLAFGLQRVYDGSGYMKSTRKGENYKTR